MDGANSQQNLEFEDTNVIANNERITQESFLKVTYNSYSPHLSNPWATCNAIQDKTICVTFHCSSLTQLIRRLTVPAVEHLLSQKRRFSLELLRALNDINWYKIVLLLIKTLFGNWQNESFTSECVQFTTPKNTKLPYKGKKSKQ